MTKCPFISYGKQYTSEVDCMGKNCAMWSYNEDICLVRLALIKYTQNSTSGTIDQPSVEDKIKSLEKQMQAVSLGFSAYPFKTPEYKMGLNTAKYPPDAPIGGDSADTPDALHFPGLNMGGL